MADLLIRNVTLPDGAPASTCWSRAAASSTCRRASMRRRPRSSMRTAICSRPVRRHFHMDATLSYGCRASTRAARCSKALRCGRAKAAALTGCAGRAGAHPLRLGSGKGLLAIRSASMSAIRGCRPSRRCCTSEKVKPYLDLQLVAFRRTACCAAPARSSSDRALRMGVDVVGGPAFRADDGRRRGKRARAVLAAERGRLVDMHCDETDDRIQAYRDAGGADVRLGPQGRVTGSHLTSMIRWTTTTCRS